MTVSSLSNTDEPPFSQRLHLHPYKNALTVSYNSDNVILPVLSARELRVEVTPDANGQLAGAGGRVEVVAYRI